MKKKGEAYEEVQGPVNKRSVYAEHCQRPSIKRDRNWFQRSGEEMTEEMRANAGIIQVGTNRKGEVGMGGSQGCQKVGRHLFFQREGR